MKRMLEWLRKRRERRANERLERWGYEVRRKAFFRGELVAAEKEMASAGFSEDAETFAEITQYYRDALHAFGDTKA